MSLHSTLTEVHRPMHWIKSGAGAAIGDLATDYSGDADRDPADSDNVNKMAMIEDTTAGTFKFYVLTDNSPVTWQEFFTGAAGGTALLADGTVTGATSQAQAFTNGVTIDSNTGLQVYDTDTSHYLTIAPGSDLTAARTLTLTTGDASRTVTLNGNPTLNDWFDQSVKQADSPTFAGVTLNNTGLHLLDTNASHDLIVAPGSDLTADRTLTLTTGDSDRTLTLSGNVTLAGTGTLTLTSNLTSQGAGSTVLSSAGAYTLTIPATGTASLLGTAQTFTAAKTFPNTGLRVLDTNASHYLNIKPGSDITANRTLTLTTGDSDRTLTLSGNVTLAGTGTLTLTNSLTAQGGGTTTLSSAGAYTLTIPATGTAALLGTAQAYTADRTLNDNVRLTLGTGGDADIWYDGTDVQVDPRVVGSGDILLAPNGGNVGIGVDPDKVFTVKGTGNADGLQFLNSSSAIIGKWYEDASGNGYLDVEDSSSAVQVRLNSSGDSYFTGGETGFGTNSPGNILHVRETDNTDTNEPFRVQRTTSGGDYLAVAAFGSSSNGSLRINNNSAGSNSFTTWSTWDLTDNRWEAPATTTVGATQQIFSTDGSIAFKTQESASVNAGDALTFNDTLTLLGSGLVGVGTASPGAQLEVEAGAAGTTGIHVEGAATPTASLLVLDQNAGDDVIAELKSSDVAHGITDHADTDTWFHMSKFSAGDGGATLSGFSEAGTGIVSDAHATTEDTTKTTAGLSNFMVRSYLKSGTGRTTHGADANLFSVHDAGLARFIVDAEGDIHYDGSASAYDDYDDAHLIRQLEIGRARSGIVQSQFDKWLKYDRGTLEREGIATFNDGPGGDGSVFVNMSALTRLHSGAIWQLYTKLETMAKALADHGIDLQLEEAH